MIRFYAKDMFGSAIMRGLQVVAALNQIGIKSIFTQSLEGAEGEVVVVVKNGKNRDIALAKERGCRIVYDLVDKLARPIHPVEIKEVTDYADVVIHCSEFSRQWWSPHMGWIPSTVIAHHWDPMMDIVKAPSLTEFSPGYIGYRFNGLYLDDLPLTVIEDPNQWSSSMKRFNFHYNVRDPKDDLLKPATKIASAAGAGANIMTLRSPISVELLGKDYPYFTNNASLDEAKRVFARAQADYGGEEWNRGIDIMKKLRGRLDLMTLVNRYAEVLTGGPL